MNNVTSVNVIKQVVPSNLDDIIRLRRDELTVRMATADELMELPPMVSVLNSQIQVSATIQEWRVICLDLHAAGKKFILVGYNETTKSVWGTSMLKSADYDSNLVLTENSVYRLGTKGNGEPAADLLLHLCFLFHKWGFGTTFGVPKIFY